MSTGSGGEDDFEIKLDWQVEEGVEPVAPAARPESASRVADGEAGGLDSGLGFGPADDDPLVVDAGDDGAPEDLLAIFEALRDIRGRIVPLDERLAGVERAIETIGAAGKSGAGIGSGARLGSGSDHRPEWVEDITEYIASAFDAVRQLETRIESILEHEGVRRPVADARSLAEPIPGGEDGAGTALLDYLEMYVATVDRTLSRRIDDVAETFDAGLADLGQAVRTAVELDAARRRTELESLSEAVEKGTSRVTDVAEAGATRVEHVLGELLERQARVEEAVARVAEDLKVYRQRVKLQGRPPVLGEDQLDLIVRRVVEGLGGAPTGGAAGAGDDEAEGTSREGAPSERSPLAAGAAPAIPAPAEPAGGRRGRGRSKAGPTVPERPAARPKSPPPQASPPRPVSPPRPPAVASHTTVPQAPTATVSTRPAPKPVVAPPKAPSRTVKRGRGSKGNPPPLEAPGPPPGSGEDTTEEGPIAEGSAESDVAVSRGSDAAAPAKARRLGRRRRP